MVLGFKKQLETPIIFGDNIHTPREDKHNRWKAGMPVQMATGVLSVNVDGKEFIYDIDTLAQNDGFTTLTKWQRFSFHRVMVLGGVK